MIMIKLQNVGVKIKMKKILGNWLGTQKRNYKKKIYYERTRNLQFMD